MGLLGPFISPPTNLAMNMYETFPVNCEKRSNNKMKIVGTDFRSECPKGSQGIFQIPLKETRAIASSAAPEGTSTTRLRLQLATSSSSFRK